MRVHSRYGFYSAGFCCFHTILLWFLGFLGLLNFLLFMLMPGWEYVGFCYVLVGLELGFLAWFSMSSEFYFGTHALGDEIYGSALNLQLGYPLPTHPHGNHTRVPVPPSTPMHATLLVCSPCPPCWHPIYLIDLFPTHQTSSISLPTHPFPYCYTPSTLPIPIFFLNHHIHFPPACMEFHMHGHSPPIPIFSH